MERGTLKDPVRTMRAALKFASRDASRLVLCTVHLDGDGGVVSTDGYRLFEKAHAWDGPSVTLDADTAKAIAKCKVKGNDEAVIERDGDTMRVTMGDGTKIVGAEAAGTYPNYRKLSCGHDWKAVARVKPEQLAVIAKAHEKVGGNHAVELWTRERDLYMCGIIGGEQEPTATFEKACDGQDASIAFNPKYLREVLGVFKGEVTVCIEGEHKPANFC